MNTELEEVACPSCNGTGIEGIDRGECRMPRCGFCGGGGSVKIPTAPGLSAQTSPPKGERTPRNPGFELSKEVIALVDEQSQYFVDHIQRRDRNWTENMDVFRSRHD